MRCFIACLVLSASLVLLPGCLVGEKGPENDFDGDFLEDPLEEMGWNLTVRTRVPDCFVFSPPDPGATRLVNSSKIDGDTDLDGVSDFQEYQFEGDPRGADTDQDGLSDKQEFDLNQRRIYYVPSGLKLNAADSDGDCLSDREEVEGQDVPGFGTRFTDPTDKDTDQDGLSDSLEMRRLGSDPTSIDSDGDGARDNLDLDPIHDLGVELVFDRLRLKTETGSVPVRVRYAFTTPQGNLEGPAGSFNASGGSDSPVPAGLSPGLVDVHDATGVGVVSLQFWAERDDGSGRVYLLTPDENVGVVTLELTPQNATWRVADVGGPADGRQAALEGPDARLEFRLWLRFV